MTESALDSLLKALGDTYPRSQAEDRNGRFLGLGNIKQVVQQSLARVRSEQVKLVHDENDCLGDFIRLLSGELRGMGQECQQRRQGVGIILAHTVLFDIHLLSQLSPDFTEGELVVCMDKTVEPDDVEVLALGLRKLFEYLVDQGSLAASTASNH